MTTSASDRRQGSYGSAAFKLPCRVATTANITLSGEQTIDGVAVVSDDRVLVWNQTTASQNGIYVADTGTWSRARDFDGTNDCVQGTFVAVTSGSTYADSIFRLTTSSPVIGTSSLTFSLSGTSALQAVSAFMQTVLDDASAGAARTTLGAVGLTGNETIAGDKTFSGATALGASATATTPTAGDNDTSVPTTAFVQTAIASRLAVNDAAGSPTATTTVVAYTAISTARTVSLPAASTVVAGRIIEIVDESGSASSTNTISVAPNGSDTIDGSNTTQVCVNIPRGSAIFMCNGTSKWIPLKWSVEYTGTLASADVAMNNTANYFDGPTIAQGTVGKWEVTATNTFTDTGGGAICHHKLWDGTSLIKATSKNVAAANSLEFVTLQGTITSPAGNLRLSSRDTSATTGLIKYNATGLSADSTIFAKRV